MVAEYSDDMIVLLQAKLDLEFYTEMTVDLVVSNAAISIANTRKILFADGLWVGNLIGESVQLTSEQESVLINVGEYARQHGYSSDIGSNCGIDFLLVRTAVSLSPRLTLAGPVGSSPLKYLKNYKTRVGSYSF